MTTDVDAMGVPVSVSTVDSILKVEYVITFINGEQNITDLTDTFKQCVQECTEEAKIHGLDLTDTGTRNEILIEKARPMLNDPTFQSKFRPNQ